MRILFTYIILTLSNLNASFATENEHLLGGSIYGKILTADNKPAEEVTVYLHSENGLKTNTSNENGYFEFSGLKKGKYTLEVNLVGYETIRKELMIEKDNRISIQLSLKLKNQQLKEVLVASTIKKMTIGRMSIAAFDLPLSTAIISNKIIQDQQVTRLGELVKNVPGVSHIQSRFGVNESYGARGYMIGVNGGAGGGSIFKNGLPFNTAGMPEAATLESVEIIKGSSAFLYGSSSGGIIINMNNKKPKFENGGSITMQTGSYQMYKPIIDLYGPISKKWAYRLVGTYENAQSFRDHVRTSRIYLNPSLLYKISEKTNILFQQDFLSAAITPDNGIGVLDSGRLLNTSIPRSRYQNVTWAYNNVIQSTSSVNLKHAFNERFSLNASGSIQNADVDTYGTGNLNTANKLGVVARSLSKAHSLETIKAAQIHFEGKINTQQIAHHFVTGLDYTSIITQSDAFQILQSNGSILKTYDTINFLNPTQFVQKTYIPNSFRTHTTTAPSNRAGIFLQDLITLHPKFKLFMGLRYSYQVTVQTRIDSTANTLRSALSVRGINPTVEYKVLNPKAGFIYQPNKASSYYISYANNFTTNTGTDVWGNLLPASIIDQYEMGWKQNFLNGRLQSNFSVYKIINSNLAQQAPFKADGISPNVDATVKTLSGETTSDGIEIGLNGTLSSDLYFVTGYGYNNIRFTNTSGLKGSNIEGERLINAPSHTANASIFYTITNKSIKGLKLGLTGFYTGQRFGGYNNIIGQNFIGSRLIALSDFTTIDCSIAYPYKKWNLQAKLSNIFNTNNYLVHDNYSINPIAPRQFMFSLQYNFKR